MRIPATKIYRAFPEFDRFDDATCERYIRAIGRAPGAFLMRAAARIAWTVCCAVLSLASIAGVTSVVASFADRVLSASESQTLRLVAVTMLFAGVVALVVMLLIRDAILRRRIAAQLKRTTCPACHYNLLGVPVSSSIDGGGVICPECGFVSTFGDIAPETADALRSAAAVQSATSSAPAVPAHPPTTRPARRS